MHKNRLYTILVLACFAGYAWLGFSLYTTSNASDGISVCLFKTVTSVPCPSCGSTRALGMLITGDLIGSVLLNPIGILLALVLICVPLLLIIDLVFNKQLLFDGFRRIEKTVNIKWIATILILLVLLNWAWNIYKGL